MMFDDGRDMTLFLGELSFFCTEEDIRELFRLYAPFIINVVIKRNNGNNILTNGQSNVCYGFVRFKTRELAFQAMQALQGVLFLGRLLKIGWADAAKAAMNPYDVASAPSNNNYQQQTAQVHISYISRQMDTIIDEFSIRRLFSHFGNVFDVCLKKTQRHLQTQSGYGFVHFQFNAQGFLSVLSAVEELHKVTLDRVTYDCSISHGLEQFLLSCQDPVLVPPKIRQYCLFLKEKMAASSMANNNNYMHRHAPPMNDYHGGGNHMQGMHNNYQGNGIDPFGMSANLKVGKGKIHDVTYYNGGMNGGINSNDPYRDPSSRDGFNPNSALNGINPNNGYHGGNMNGFGYQRPNNAFTSGFNGNGNTNGNNSSYEAYQREIASMKREVETLANHQRMPGLNSNMLLNNSNHRFPSNHMSDNYDLLGDGNHVDTFHRGKSHEFSLNSNIDSRFERNSFPMNKNSNDMNSSVSSMDRLRMLQDKFMERDIQQKQQQRSPPLQGASLNSVGAGLDPFQRQPSDGSNDSRFLSSMLESHSNGNSSSTKQSNTFGSQGLEFGPSSLTSQGSNNNTNFHSSFSYNNNNSMNSTGEHLHDFHSPPLLSVLRNNLVMSAPAVVTSNSTNTYTTTSSNSSITNANIQEESSATDLNLLSINDSKMKNVELPAFFTMNVPKVTTQQSRESNLLDEALEGEDNDEEGEGVHNKPNTTTATAIDLDGLIE